MPQEAKDVRILTLAGLADGAADELWAAVLKRVLENIQDPNTDHKAKRSITLRFDFEADEDRQVGEVALTCSSKLASGKAVKTVVFYGRDHGELVAVEQPRQKDMFPEPAGRPQGLIGGKE